MEVSGKQPNHNTLTEEYTINEFLQQLPNVLFMEASPKQFGSGLMHRRQKEIKHIIKILIRLSLDATSESNDITNIKTPPYRSKTRVKGRKHNYSQTKYLMRKRIYRFEEIT